MDPITIAALAQAGMGVVQQYSSGVARRRAKRNFQNYTIPQSANTMLDVARDFSMERELPGSEMYRNRALGSAARAVEAAQRTAEAPSDVLAVLGRAYGRDYMDFEKNLATMSIENRMRGRSAYMSALDRMTQLETQRWEMNELMPYMQKMNEAAQLEAAGGANIQSALSTGATMWNANEAMKSERSMFDEYLKWKKGSGGLSGSNPYAYTGFNLQPDFSVPSTSGYGFSSPSSGVPELPQFDPSFWRFNQQMNRFNF